MKYQIEQIPITEYNKTKLAKTIQPLYQELWNDNHIFSIKKRFEKYQKPHISLIWYEGELVGFGIYFLEVVQNQNVLFRGGAVIHQAHRGNGLYTKMIVSTANQFPETSVFCVRTKEIQVYKSFCTLSETLSNAKLYPKVTKGNKEVIPRQVQEIMQYFSESASEVTNGVAQGVYTKNTKSNLASAFGLGNTDALMIVIKACR